MLTRHPNLTAAAGVLGFFLTVYAFIWILGTSTLAGVIVAAATAAALTVLYIRMGARR